MCAKRAKMHFVREDFDLERTYIHLETVRIDTRYPYIATLGIEFVPDR